MNWLETVNWNDAGLVPVVTQDVDSGKVLMLAWMSRDALAATVNEGRAVYWSRTRQRLWRKGEISGHIQRVREIRLDCDNDTILLQVHQVGGIACHTGRQSCLFRRYSDGRWVEVEPVLKPPAALYGDDNSNQ